jgi:uncharacterized RDD family membrane protein YckC
MATTGLFCTKCGHMNSADAAFCAKCGAPQPSAQSAPAGAPAAAAAATAYPTAYTPSVPRAIGYGGFWIRFVAFIIDTLVIRAAMIPFGFLFVGRLILLGGFPPHRGGMTPEDALPFAAAMGKLFLLQIVAWWLYEALMTSSSKQGTLGKMVFGLKVTDMQGQRISFGHATARHFAKYVSVLTAMIGFIVAGFTAKKQALHDLIAGTVVVKTVS